MTQITSELYSRRKEDSGQFKGKFIGNRDFLGHITIASHRSKEEIMRIIKQIEEKTNLEIK